MTSLLPGIALRAPLVNVAYAEDSQIELARVVNGMATVLATGNFAADGTAAVKIKIYNDSGSHRFKVWVDGSLEINTTDSTIPSGGVAFGGYASKFDNCKIGYDVTNDDDINDPTDDLVWNEDFSGTSKTPVYNHAGNMVDDGTFRYVYDAWNRLVKVQASLDADVVYQTAEFDALGRRIKKAVTSAGDYDKTEVYFYNGQQIVQINNGSGAMVQQFIHGTQYIDELVMIRVKDKGDLYVHQDANWNVIGTTDLGRHVVERNVYTPYGELTVHQDTGFGDRDGDADVDSTDKGTVGTTCTGTVSGSCRILDLDFDGDYDSTDAAKFDALTQGSQRHPGRASTATWQPFAHQGLPFEPELAQYQNRARQYDPGKRRFAQRDPRGLRSEKFDARGYYFQGFGLYERTTSNPTLALDPTGLANVFCNHICYQPSVQEKFRKGALAVATCCLEYNTAEGPYVEPVLCLPKVCYSDAWPTLPDKVRECGQKHEDCHGGQGCGWIPSPGPHIPCYDTGCGSLASSFENFAECPCYQKEFECLVGSQEHQRCNFVKCLLDSRACTRGYAVTDDDWDSLMANCSGASGPGCPSGR